MHFARIFLLTTLSLLTASGNDLVSKIKAGTAFLSVPKSGSSGTAFCISEKGYFVTCAHVLGNTTVGQEVILTINSGLPDAKEAKATVVKVDPARDLAILEAAPDLAKPLRLGHGKTLKETDAITVAGYPFGTLLAVEKRPAISIATGKITALRREGTVVAQIQFDADIQSGNSGGPLLNARGEVIGVVASRIPGSQLSFAVSSDLLRAIIDSPTSKFENLLPISYANRHAPYSFDLELAYLRPPTSPSEVTASFTGSVSGTRPLLVKKTGNHRYHLSGVPYPKDQNTSGRTLRTELIRISGNFTTTVTASHDDLEFTIGGRKHFLSNFKLIYPPEEKALTTEGKVIKGPIAGLDRVIVQKPGYGPQIQNFQDWPIVTIRPDGFTPEIVKLEIKISGNGYVNTLAKTLDIENPTNVLNAALLPGEKPPTTEVPKIPLPRDPIEITFESEITDLDYGGNGRFVAAFIAAENSCHIIDCLTGSTLHKVPATPDSRIAAGLTTLFIVNSVGVSKWDLETGKNLTRDQAWFDGPVQDISVGSGSDRFLAVAYRAYERKDMTRVELRSQENGRLLAIEPTELDHQENSLLAISERGTSIGLSSPPPNKATQGLLRLQNGRYQVIHPGSIGWIKPGPLDQILVSGTGQIGINPHGFGGQRTHDSTYGLIPTTHQGLALAVPLIPERPDSKTKYPGIFSLFDTNTGRPLVKKIVALDGFISDPAARANHSRGDELPPRFPWDERFFYSVDHGHLLAVPSDNRRLLIHPIDLKETLVQQKSPFLLIESDAPIQLQGDTFEAQLNVLSSEEELRYELITSPPGFEVNGTGLITGKITTSATGQPQQLIVLVKTGQLERFWKHTFYAKR